MLPQPTVTILARDPPRKNPINVVSYQQHALLTANGYQYAVYYAAIPSSPQSTVYIHLSRRRLPSSEWDTIIFTDYPQTTDDGHNTVQLGVCPSDGTIHLAYDHHCDPLRYRVSVPGVATDPEKFKWDADLFTPTLDALPGIDRDHIPFGYITYPRFCAAEKELFLTFRDGKAGLGDDHLYVYSPVTTTANTAAVAETAKTGDGQGVEKGWTYLGPYLHGILSNPYINALSYSPPTPRSRSFTTDPKDPDGGAQEEHGTLHVTLTWRGFVPYEGCHDPLDTKHKQQAGPNSAYNNHNICHTYSTDLGRTWRNTEGTIIANLANDEAVSCESEGVTVFEIQKGSGLINQEGQAAFREDVHVLMRERYDHHLKGLGQIEGYGIKQEDGDEGGVWWMHYHGQNGTWTRRPIKKVNGNLRGEVAVGNDGDVYFLLPDSMTPTLRIVKARRQDEFSTCQQVWEGEGFTGEPLVDPGRLEHGVLSLFVIVIVEGTRHIAVLDFQP
ncbi:hypothetical protein OQA88_7662 [Cercophora sp. LCS_1]